MHCSLDCVRKDADFISKRIKNSMVKKYGVENVSQLESIKEKKRQTSLKNWGTENVAQHPEVRRRMAATCMEKYGVDVAAKSDEIKKKLSQTRQNWSEERKVQYSKNLKAGMWRVEFEKLKKALEACHLKFNEGQEYMGWRSDKWNQYWLTCEKCGHVFLKTFHPGHPMKEWCRKCHPRLGHSKGEDELYAFVKSLCPDAIQGDRTVISPRELDVLVLSRNLAFEFNGLYWHSDAIEGDRGARDYHKNKTDACEKKGVWLIHVFEDEWMLKNDLVKSRIRHLLGMTERTVYARDCKIRSIEPKICSQFLEDNHIQGKVQTKVRYGLYKNNELVAVMCFGKPRYDLKHDWELLRYATLQNVSVVGGASKLYGFFKKYNRGTVISYADRSWSKGNMYEKLGFKRIGDGGPSYWYVCGCERLSRNQFMKHLLVEKFGLDPDLTEEQMANVVGYHRIYGPGSFLYADEKS